jgi:amino acid transporter
MEEKGKIPFFAAVLMGMNIMLGAGIYMMPQKMAKIADSLSVFGWVLAALLLFPIIRGVARASQVFPGAGGFYNYCKQGINETAGFLASWAYLIGYLGTVCALVLFIKDALVAHGFAFVGNYSFLFSFLLLLIISLLNLLSLELISKVQSGATLLKLTPLIFVIVVCGFYFGGAPSFNPEFLTSVPLTVPVALFAFWGFESCCGIGHLIKGGQSQVLKVIYTAFFTVAAMYTLFHFGVMSIMGVENLKAFGAISFPKFLGFGPAITKIIELIIGGAILLSFFNALYGVSLANITNLFNFAEQKTLPGSKHLVRVNKFDRPIYIVFLHGAIALLLVTLIPNAYVWGNLTGLGVMIAFTLTQISVFIYDLKNSCYGSLFITTVGFVSLAVAMYYTCKGLGLLYASPVIIGIAAGYAMYKFAKKSNA